MDEPALRCKEEPPAEHSDDGNAMVAGVAVDFLAKFDGTSFDTLVAETPDSRAADFFGRRLQRLEDAADETECSGDEVEEEEKEAKEEAKEEEEKIVVVPPWRCVHVGAGSASRAKVGAGSASRAADPRGRARASSKELLGILKACVPVAAAAAAAVAVPVAAAAAAEEVRQRQQWQQWCDSGNSAYSSSATAATCRPASGPSAFNYGPGTGEHVMDDKGKMLRFFDNGHLTFLMIVLRSRMRQCLKLVSPSFKFELLSFFCSDNGHLTFLMAR